MKGKEKSNPQRKGMKNDRGRRSREEKEKKKKKIEENGKKRDTQD
jgi:hypothetical protein